MDRPGVLADPPATFDGHPYWQLFQRIVASPQFMRSARLKAFLQYVTQCALLDHVEQVTEQQIGVHVFGKPADYNASEDNIVRSQARFLRQKLTEYFDSEPGREEPVVLIIPKGTYLPQFSVRSEVEAPAATPGLAPSVQTPASPGNTQALSSWKRPKLFWILATAAAICLVAVALLLWRQEQPPASVPDSGLWPHLFEPHRQTTIVASDYIFSMVQEAAGHPLSLDDYLGADYYSRVSQLNSVSRLDHLFPNIDQRHYTGFENVTGIARLVGLKQAQSAQTVIRFSRDLTMRDVGVGNLVLFGSKQSNPWVSLFEAKLNFRFEYQAAVHDIFIANRTPQAGEEAEYRPSALDARSRVIYGVIAFLPNLSPGSNVLILEGTSMGATEAALELLQTPALFRDLVWRVNPRGRPTDPPYFEVLIRTRTVNSVPAESSIVAIRSLGQ